MCASIWYKDYWLAQHGNLYFQIIESQNFKAKKRIKSVLEVLLVVCWTIVTIPPIPRLVMLSCCAALLLAAAADL